MSDLEASATNAESLGLDHMRAFIAVVETGSQAAAARRLRAQQTTISRHIKRVQEHFGGGLFVAGASGPLTTRGLLVEQSLRAAMAELSRTRDRLAVDRPVLRIGFIRAMRPLVEKALRSQVKVHGIPAFDVRLLELSNEVQARALVRRELDIAIAYAVPELATRAGIEASLVTEEPFALVIPERAWVDGRPSLAVLAPLLYAYSPRRLSNQVAEAGERWLSDHRLEPKSTVECAMGSEIIAYAGSGYGYGFLPALWSMADHEGVVFAPVAGFSATARIAAYSLQHVSPWVTRLRENLTTAAQVALQDFRARQPTKPASPKTRSRARA
jgi:DNA-binding transcriptional LysR family regulator